MKPWCGQILRRARSISPSGVFIAAGVRFSIIRSDVEAIHRSVPEPEAHAVPLAQDTIRAIASVPSEWNADQQPDARHSRTRTGRNCSVCQGLSQRRAGDETCRSDGVTLVLNDGILLALVGCDIGVGFSLSSGQPAAVQKVMSEP